MVKHTENLRILTALKGTVEYIHTVVEMSPPSIFRTLFNLHNWSSVPIKQQLPILSPLPAPENYHSNFCLCDYDCPKYLI